MFTMSTSCEKIFNNAVDIVTLMCYYMFTRSTRWEVTTMSDQEIQIAQKLIERIFNMTPEQSERLCLIAQGMLLEAERQQKTE